MKTAYRGADGRSSSLYTKNEYCPSYECLKNILYPFGQAARVHVSGSILVIDERTLYQLDIM